MTLPQYHKLYIPLLILCAHCIPAYSQNIAPVTAKNNKLLLKTTPYPDAISNGLSGNRGGVRDWLTAKGINFSISDTNEFWSNPVGGEKASNNYIGSTTVEMKTDLKALTGLNLGIFDISAMEIRGRPFSNTPLYVFNQTSNIEADDNIRLYEISYSQTLFKGHLNFRIGKLDLGQDFMSSKVGLNFLNASFSWPIMPDNDLYDQGPVSPIATPAIRLHYIQSPQWDFLFAAANDNPTGAVFISSKDPWNQNSDPSGTKFNFNTGALFFFETQYKAKLYDRKGTYKLGGYFDTGRFPDQSDFEKSHKNNWSIYTVVDQTIQNFSPTTAVDAFIRGNWTSDTDRNQIVYAADGGVVLKGPFKRAVDILGLGFGLGVASPRLAQADRRAGMPGQGVEYHLELTYQLHFTSWFLLQPDMQGILSPSGGVLDSKKQRVQNEAIFGLHSCVVF